MNRRYKVILVAAFTGFLAIVGLQEIWRFIPQGGKLHGIVAEPEPVVWSRNALTSGRFMGNLEKWFNVRVGLRNVWVALDNQVNYTVFGEVTPRKNENGTQVIAGIHDWFFEYHYITEAVAPPWTWSDAQLQATVDQLHTVQAKLAARGIPMLLVVAPSKVQVYPEHVPSALLGGRTIGAKPTNFDRARPMLETAGVNFYDGPADFAARKAAGERNLFARSGTHWSYAAVVPVVQRIREKLNPRLRHPIPEIKVAATPGGPPRDDDWDLLQLTNLIVAAPYAHDLPFPKMVRQTEVAEKDLPRILWVNDSFGEQPIQLLYDANAVQPSTMLWYYYLASYKLPRRTFDERDKTDLDVKTIDWPEFLKSYDAVVIVWTEIAYVSDPWWRFLKDVDTALGKAGN